VRSASFFITTGTNQNSKKKQGKNHRKEYAWVIEMS
jgi:hypothetical protein